MTAEEWFARAVVRMIMSDKILHRKEWKSLKLSIQKLGLDVDIEDVFAMLQENTNTNPEEFRLESMASIPLETRVKMAIELAKIAAIDKEAISYEMDFLRKASSLLGLNQIFINKIIEWANDLAKLNRDEKELYELSKRT